MSETPASDYPTVPFIAKLHGAHDHISALTAVSLLEHAILSLIVSLLACLIRHFETVVARTAGPIANLRPQTRSLRPQWLATTIFTSKASAPYRDGAQPYAPASSRQTDSTTQTTQTTNPTTPSTIKPKPHPLTPPKTTLRSRITRPNRPFQARPNRYVIAMKSDQSPREAALFYSVRLSSRTINLLVSLRMKRGNPSGRNPGIRQSRPEKKPKTQAKKQKTFYSSGPYW